MSILSTPASLRFDLFRRSLIQTEHLPMADVLNCHVIEEVFEEHKIVFGIADEDVFTPAITLWAMVSQFLFSGSGRSCKAAAGRVVSLWSRIAGRVVSQNAGNYCRAKAKIPMVAIREITRRLAHHAEQGARAFDDVTSPLDEDQAEDRLSPSVIAQVRMRPLRGRIILVDGFTVDAPDTPENQAAFPQNPSQAEGLGFPVLRCVALFSLTTGLLIDLAFAPYSGKGSGETSLLRKLKGSLRPGDILVADSCYCTYWLIAMCQQMGVEVVMKNHQKRDDHPLGAMRISDSERTIKWLRPDRPDWMSKGEYRKVAGIITVRLIDVSTDPVTSRSKGFTLATTMFDCEEHPADWVSALYESRWNVEPDIRSQKVTMGLEHLRSLTPEGIERELWTGLLAYNLVRAKMLQSGCEAKREIRSMSFTETYQLLSTNWLLCACSVVSGAMATSAQVQGACAVVGARPGRIEPRENKRRPKVLKLMTVPRRIFKAAIAALRKIT